MKWGSGLAGEIAQEVAVALALGSAAIGAGGSVLSQAVGGYITSKREKKKAEADDRRWQIESDAKRRDRGLDQKIALFSRFLATMEGIKRAEAWGKPINHAAFLEYNQTLDGLQETLEEIGLVAPDVYRHLKRSYDSVIKMLFTKIGSKFEQGDPGAVMAARHADETLNLWMWATRNALRSYVNHEPVEWPEQRIAEHYARQREERKAAESVDSSPAGPQSG